MDYSNRCLNRRTLNEPGCLVANICGKSLKLISYESISG